MDQSTTSLHRRHTPCHRILHVPQSAHTYGRGGRRPSARSLRMPDLARWCFLEQSGWPQGPPSQMHRDAAACGQSHTHASLYCRMPTLVACAFACTRVRPVCPQLAVYMECSTSGILLLKRYANIGIQDSVIFGPSSTYQVLTRFLIRSDQLGSSLRHVSKLPCVQS